MAKRYEIGFGVGFTRFGGHLTDVDGKIQRLLHRASEIFGGAYLYRGVGGWYNPKTGEYVGENAAVLRIDTTRSDAGKSIESFATYVKYVLEQESVVFSVSEVQTEFL